MPETATILLCQIEHGLPVLLFWQIHQRRASFQNRWTTAENGCQRLDQAGRTGNRHPRHSWEGCESSSEETAPAKRNTSLREVLCSAREYHLVDLLKLRSELQVLIPQDAAEDKLNERSRACCNLRTLVLRTGQPADGLCELQPGLGTDRVLSGPGDSFGAWLVRPSWQRKGIQKRVGARLARTECKTREKIARVHQLPARMHGPLVLEPCEVGRRGHRAQHPPTHRTVQRQGVDGRQRIGALVDHLQEALGLRVGEAQQRANQDFDAGAQQPLVHGPSDGPGDFAARIQHGASQDVGADHHGVHRRAEQSHLQEPLALPDGVADLVSARPPWCARCFPSCHARIAAIERHALIGGEQRVRRTGQLPVVDVVDAPWILASSEVRNVLAICKKRKRAAAVCPRRRRAIHVRVPLFANCRVAVLDGVHVVLARLHQEVRAEGRLPLDCRVPHVFVVHDAAVPVLGADEVVPEAQGMPHLMADRLPHVQHHIWMEGREQAALVREATSLGADKGLLLKRRC
eukprot:scaffold228_cov312-Pinguiococcus_pyrenoidosus.AAC.17